MTYPGSATVAQSGPTDQWKASNAAHATTTLEEAQRLMPGRESVTGEPQEIVKYDLAN
jgi:hypothetical protein